MLNSCLETHSNGSAISMNSQDKIKEETPGSKLKMFKEYLAKEVKDVADFKRFLAQLRESIQKKQSKEQKKPT